MESLSKLNERGRMIIELFRNELDNLDLYGKDSGDPKYPVEVEAQRHLLAG